MVKRVASDTPGPAQPGNAAAITPLPFGTQVRIASCWCSPCFPSAVRTVARRGASS
jgi:hypothetical protein